MMLTRYNSAVYASVSTNDYSAYVVNGAFLEDERCLDCNWIEQESYSTPGLHLRPLDEPFTMWKRALNGSLDRLEPWECLTEYATALQSYRGCVLLVTNEVQRNDSWPSQLTQLNSTHIYWSDIFSSVNGTDSSLASRAWNWICSGLDYTLRPGFYTPDPELRCTDELGNIRAALAGTLYAPIDTRPRPWCVGGPWPVKYCLSEPIVPRCRLHFSPVIGKIVTALNLCKSQLSDHIRVRQLTFKQ